MDVSEAVSEMNDNWSANLGLTSSYKDRDDGQLNVDVIAIQDEFGHANCLVEERQEP